MTNKLLATKLTFTEFDDACMNGSIYPNVSLERRTKDGAPISEGLQN
jgi:hypothetical protein